MSAIRKILTVARGNLLGPILDPAGAFFVFVVPVVIIAVLGLTLSRPPEVPIGVVADGRNPVAASVLDELDSVDGASVHLFRDVATLEFALRRQTIAAGLVVPADADADLRAGRRANFSIVVDSTHAYPVAARSVIAAATDRVGTAYQAARFASETSGGDFERALQIARSQPDHASLRREGTTGGAALKANGFDYAAPATVFLFMFVNTLTFATGMVVARQLGCLRRMAATPTRPVTILVGDFLGRYVLAAIQGVLIIAVGSLAFGVTWGNLGGAILLVLLFAAVSVGAGELLGSLARTREQVLAVAGPAGLALAMLGGCIWPLSIVAPTMRNIARAVPHSWAIDAAQKLQYGLPLRSVAGSFAILGVFAVAFVGVAHTRLSTRLGTS